VIGVRADHALKSAERVDTVLDARVAPAHDGFSFFRKF